LKLGSLLIVFGKKNWVVYKGVIKVMLNIIKKREEEEREI